MSNSKDDLAQTQIHAGKYHFQIEIKGQGHTEEKNVRDT